MLLGHGMVMNRHLFKGTELGHHGLEEGFVDVVVQVLDRDFNLGRLTDVVGVHLERSKCMKLLS